MPCLLSLDHKHLEDKENKDGAFSFPIMHEFHSASDIKGVWDNFVKHNSCTNRRVW